MAQWRRFAFFEKELLKGTDGKPWLRGVNITCASANRGVLVYGDADGAIHLADRQLEISKFQAYEHFVSHVVMLQTKNFLVTVGDGIDPRDPEQIKKSRERAKAARDKSEEQEYSAKRDVKKSTALVKIWRTDQQDREGHPKMLQQIRIFAKYPEEGVTSFSVTEDLSQIAVGLKNGAVILFRSDLKRRGDQRPPVLLQPASQHRVTALDFTEHPDESGNTKLFLYAATRRGLTCYQCTKDDTPSGSMHRAVVLDERGVAPNCSAVNDRGEIAVGQQDAVYFYNTEDRGVCFGFDGEKKFLHFFKHYLLIAHIDPRGRHQLNVYDLKNKFIAFNWTLSHAKSSRRRGPEPVEKVRQVVCEFGSIFIVSSLGNVFRLTEKDTASKLDILFRKNLFSIAISLAFSSNYDINNIMDIYRMFGDHLYKKGDYNGAVNQYSRTIGHVEPSYVIQRFLDAQRIHNLTTYLEALHEKAFANSEHTTLLLNCYTKTKDVKKLDRFICPEGFEEQDDRTTTVSSTASTISASASITSKPSISNHKENSNESERQIGANALTFEIETAISVLRRNYPKHALYLAKNKKEHSWYLKIQLEDISYVDHNEPLKPAEQERVLDAFQYIKKLPFAEAESNLKKYGRTLVAHLPEETTELLKLLCTGRYCPLNGQSSKIDDSCKSDPADFIHLYVAHPRYLKEFLKYIVTEEHKLSTSIGNTLLEMILQNRIEDCLTEEGKELTKDQIDEFRKEREDQVMKLLDNPRVNYDEDHALILVQMHDIKKGQRYLYNKLHMYHMLIQHYMENNNDRLVIEEVKKHGDKDSNLWLLALKYFTQRGPGKTGDWKELKEILENIDTNHAIPPLQVVQVLSQSSQVPLSVVRPFIINRLSADSKKLKEDSEEIQKFKQDTEDMKLELRELKSKATVFQSTKCDLCKYELDLPAVHFMCQHSFHQTCIPENERECLVCDQEHRHVQNLKLSLQQKAENHEQFFNQLETSVNGFNTIAEYFGKGIFKIEDPKKLETVMETRFSNEF